MVCLSTRGRLQNPTCFEIGDSLFDSEVDDIIEYSKTYLFQSACSTTEIVEEAYNKIM